MVPVTSAVKALLSVTVAVDCVAATPVDGKPVIVIVGAAAITIVNVWNRFIAAVREVAFAEIVNLALPATMGVPLIMPVDAFRFNPAGNVPVDTCQLEAVKPGTVKVVVGYGTFTNPLGSVPGLIDADGKTLMPSAWVALS